MVRTTTLQACFLLFRTKVQKARRFACSSASILVVVWLAAWAVLKGSGATALDGTAVDVVASAFLKSGSASSTNHTTSHVTTKLAAAAKKKINDRFVMSLPSGDRDIGGHRGVARPQNLTNYVTSRTTPIAATACVLSPKL